MKKIQVLLFSLLVFCLLTICGALLTSFVVKLVLYFKNGISLNFTWNDFIYIIQGSALLGIYSGAVCWLLVIFYNRRR